MYETMDDSAELPLSRKGQLHRAEILQMARQESRTRRRRRFARRATVAVGVCLLMGVSILLTTHQTKPDHPQIAHPTPLTQPEKIQTVGSREVGPRQEIVISRIETDLTLLRRLTIPPQKPSWTVIDEDELLRRLTEAGRPAALAYVEGRTLILFREARNH